MKYWHMNLHPTNEQGTDEDIANLVLSRTVGMGDWERGVPQITDFKERVSIGDVIAVLNGRTPIALVEIIGDWYQYKCDKSSIVWYEFRRATKILSLKNEINFPENLPVFPMVRTRTLGISVNKETETYKYIDNWVNYCRQVDAN